MRILIATIKSWNIINAEKLAESYGDKHNIRIIHKKEELTGGLIEEFHPDIIFFPHWSYVIPEEIYKNTICVVFHMTDLPFGRGGSPLQNLIIRGYQETKISALRVTKEIDAGPIYMKEKLSLEGSAEQVFKRASDIIFEKMIPVFMSNNLTAKEQIGTPVFFKRRKPEESELQESMSLQMVYDYIRMLDAEGYPKAYINFGKLKLVFKNAKIQEGKLATEVEITEEDT